MVSPLGVRPVVPPPGVKQVLSKLRETVGRGRKSLLELQLESQAWIARKKQELTVRARVCVLLQHGHILYFVVQLSL